MSTVLVLPILIPLASAAAALTAWRSERTQRFIGVAGAAALFVASLALLYAVRREGAIATQIGDWPAPFGITLVADMLTALMVAVTGLMGLAVAVYSTAEVDPGRRAFGFYPLLHVLLMGVCGAFLTGDLFNLYVWFEVMLIASFVLLALGGERPQMEGALKYVTLNMVSSAIFLAGVGLIYGVTGTLNMAHLSELVAELSATHPDLVAAVAGLLLVSFGIKAGTLGTALILLGIAITSGEMAIGMRVVLIVLFLFLTAPLAAHMIARAAYRSGTPLSDETVIDEYREACGGEDGRVERG